MVVAPGSHQPTGLHLHRGASWAALATAICRRPPVANRRRARLEAAIAARAPSRAGCARP
eukprot:849008-Lingulodinium_polyedra.AAC.1